MNRYCNDAIRILTLILVFSIFQRNVFSQNTNSPWLCFYGVAANSKIDIAICSGGTIYKSYDGINWTKEAFTVNSELLYVQYLNNKFIIIGTNGTLLSSSDGITWKKNIIDANCYIKNIFYVNNKYMVSAFSQNKSKISVAKLYVSDDFKTWKCVYLSLINLPNSFQAFFSDFDMLRYYSYDLSVGINNVIYYKNKYIAVLNKNYINNEVSGIRSHSYIISTSNLKDWIETDTHSSINSLIITSNKNGLIASGFKIFQIDATSNKLNVICDLNDLELNSDVNKNFELYDIKYIDGKYIGIGIQCYNNTYNEPNDPLYERTFVVVSNDGINWSRTTINSDDLTNMITIIDNNQFSYYQLMIKEVDNIIFIHKTDYNDICIPRYKKTNSQNRIEWTQISLPYPKDFNSTHRYEINIKDFMFDGKKFIAVGGVQGYGYNEGYIIYSYDKKNWTLCKIN